MANDLATVNRQAMAEILTLPEWLLSKTTELHRLNADRSLPESQRLGQLERKWCEEQIAILEASLAILMANEVETISEVGSFLMVYTNSNLSDREQEARAKAYAVALDDIPTWALKGAIRRWHRGEVRAEGINYSWPQPSMLRAACLETINLAQGKLIMLKNLMAANDAPLPVEYTDEYRNNMLEKIAGLFGKKREALG